MRAGIAAALLLFAGCATVAEVDLSDPACAETFRRQMVSILVQEGEKPDEAEEVAHRAATMLSYGVNGVRPFAIGSRTTDYTFFVDRRKPGCLLRLLSRQRGFTRYTNDITYIATRPLPGCRCSSD